VQSGIHGPCVSSVKQTKKSTPLIPIQHVHRHVWSLGTNSTGFPVAGAFVLQKLSRNERFDEHFIRL
jgi:hypothetical protein